MELTGGPGCPLRGWAGCGNGSWLGGLRWRGKDACCTAAKETTRAEGQNLLLDSGGHRKDDPN